jgi:hypothetical protein
MNDALSSVRIWRAPGVLAVMTAMGLTAALFGDGVWDVVSWFTLGAPVAVVIRYLVGPQPDPARRPT